MTMLQTNHLREILIVAPDLGQRNRIERACRGAVVVHGVSTVNEALNWLHDHQGVSAAIVNQQLPDGDGLEVVAMVRRRYGVPTLLVSSRNSHRAIHGAFELGSGYLCTPVSDRQVDSFVQHALTLASGSGAGHRRAAIEFSRRSGLTPREEEIVQLAVAGVRRRDMPTSLGIAESTLKWHIRSLLHKSDATNLSEVVRLVLSSDAVIPGVEPQDQLVAVV